MNKVEKKLDVLCLGAAVVDIPLRPVSREVFDIESYPVDNIAMAVGGDAMNESTIISRLGFKTGLMAAIGDDAAGAFILLPKDIIIRIRHIIYRTSLRQRIRISP